MNERKLKHSFKKPILMFTFCPYREDIYINVHDFAYCTWIYCKTDNTVRKVLTSSYCCPPPFQYPRKSSTTREY
jgi:hypothetical protein